MISINRGAAPAGLAAVRRKELARLRGLGREPKGEEIVGYRVVAEALWRVQFRKCCYCEHKIRRCYNDVEHYRPKGRADRLPGCRMEHGYWWLAFDWDNLLFACPACNRSGKNDRFPLATGTSSLRAEDAPPGGEDPLLIDPCRINPVEHIQYALTSLVGSGGPLGWWARPRAFSVLGATTIDVCNLNHSDLVELRNDHVDQVVAPRAQELLEAIAGGDDMRVDYAFERATALLRPEQAFVAVAFDALKTLVPPEALKGGLMKRWPDPHEVPLAQ